jgi:hypothetical protein
VQIVLRKTENLKRLKIADCESFELEMAQKCAKNFLALHVLGAACQVVGALNGHALPVAMLRCSPIGTCFSLCVDACCSLLEARAMSMAVAAGVRDWMQGAGGTE